MIGNDGANYSGKSKSIIGNAGTGEVTGNDRKDRVRR